MNETALIVEYQISPDWYLIGQLVTDGITIRHRCRLAEAGR